MSDIFLSYKAEDRARVKPLVDALTAEGLSVWWDVHIEGGAAWRDTIRSNLDAAACVIVVWSEASVGPAGHFVQDEASRARRRGVYLPVALDPVEPPLGFGQDHSLKLIGWRGGRRDPRFTDILAAARALIAGGPRPTPTARVRAIGKASGPPWRPVVVAAAAAVAVAAIAALAVVGPSAPLCRMAGTACPWASPKAPLHSIAVLPLTNLSGDPTQDYFSDGLTEELIGRLARLGGLQVAGRTSSFKFKASKDDSKVIGAKLGVNYLIDGSVRRSGQVVRVSAQLIDAPTGFERWSETYDRDMKDIFAVQSGIAEAVADALKVRLLGGDIAALSRGGTTSPDAYDHYLRGRRLFDVASDEASFRDALKEYDAAIAADPSFASAHSGRARVLEAIANQFAEGAEARKTLDAALASARRAADLAPGLAEAQATLAQTLLYATLDYSEARPLFARAMAGGGSGDADILNRIGLASCRAGDFASGLPAVRRAVSLDPLNPRVFKSLGLALTAARRYPDAIAAMRRALDLSPGASTAHNTIGDALYLQGQLPAAKAEYDLEPAAWARQRGRAIVLRKLGDVPGAEAAFRQLRAPDNGITAYQQAQVLAQWGDRDGAIKALQAALATGDTGILWMPTDPLLDPVRTDPRFASLMTRMGLPP